jgi:DNA-binding response OmpR family regulator
MNIAYELPATTKTRVLLVEDDFATHEILRKILTRRGYDVLSALTLAGAVELIEQDPDCLILDLMLPDGGGEGLLRRVRSEVRPIRVIVTSAVCDPERLRELEALGPDAILTKPITMSELLARLGPPERRIEPGA